MRRYCSPCPSQTAVRADVNCVIDDVDVGASFTWFSTIWTHAHSDRSTSGCRCWMISIASRWSRRVHWCSFRRGPVGRPASLSLTTSCPLRGAYHRYPDSAAAAAAEIIDVSCAAFISYHSHFDVTSGERVLFSRPRHNSITQSFLISLCTCNCNVYMYLLCDQLALCTYSVSSSLGGQDRPIHERELYVCHYWWFLYCCKKFGVK